MRIAPSLLFVLVILLSCTTAPSVAKPQEPTATPVPAEVAPAVAEVPPVNTGKFQVSAEKKKSSLIEIRVLVDKLNEIIAKKAYSEWRTYLDSDYIRANGDPAHLRALSTSSPYLKQFNIKLKNLEDYFLFVVVPSRANVTVDDISFVDEDRVEVWTVVDNEKVLLYLLKLYGKEWKISSW